jgi:DNA-binding response OmpR family regulator
MKKMKHQERLMPIPIVVAEDNGDIQKLIRLSLDAERYRLHEAATGLRALELARAVRPRLMLLDIMMPEGMDGFDVCRHIRSDAAMRGTRILMLSARGQLGDMEAGLAAGADLYLAKPFSPAELVAWVERLLADASPIFTTRSST